MTECSRERCARHLGYQAAFARVSTVWFYSSCYTDIEYKNLRSPKPPKRRCDPLNMGDPCTAKALLLPADGSAIKIVTYRIEERDDEDMADSGMAEFFDPIPDLKAWYGNGY